jgi:ferrochelatase
MARGVLLIAHGTVEHLDDLPAFLANIRRGHAAPPELVAEVRRRYEAIGGQSPLLAISRSAAARLEGLLGVPVRVAMRLWSPYPREVLRELAEAGARDVAVVPLAQHSAKVYEAAVREAAAELPGTRVVAAANWGRTPELVAAFAAALVAALESVSAEDRAATSVLFTAHSLPTAVVRAGDPYEEEFRASAALVARAVGDAMPRWSACFQSQGMGTGPGGRPIEWMGPDLKSALEEQARAGVRHVVLAPIGFLADHVEILYDLDIEAVGWARKLGIRLSRTASLNDGQSLVAALAAVARPLLAELSA